MCCWVEEEPAADHRAHHTPRPHSPWRGQSHCQVPHHPNWNPKQPLPSSSSRSEHQPAGSMSHLDRGKPFLLPVSASPTLARSGILSEAQWPLASSLTSHALLFLPATHVFPRGRGLPALTSSCWHLHTHQGRLWHSSA